MNLNMDVQRDEFCMNLIREYDEIQNNVEPFKTKSIPISSYKNSILETHAMLQQLKGLKDNISKCDITSDTFNESMKLYLDFKQRIQETLEGLENKISQNVRKQYEKRILKRKKKNKSWQLQKEHSKERRRMLEFCINECIKSNQEKVELQKKEESARRNADIILSDIRSKRTDCKKSITVLQELGILRRAKMNIAKGSNDNSFQEAHGAFLDKIFELKKKWKKLDEIYQSEEKVLKSQIKSEDPEFVNDVKNNHFNWETGLLGTKLLGTNYGDYNWSTMITTRRAWDSCISHTDGFELPTGWVIPCEPSNAAWTKYVQENTSH